MGRRILSLSANTRLLITRNDMLAAAGYSVSSPRRPEDAFAMLAAAEFDALVCGHSVQKPERDKLLSKIRKACPDLPIIFVFAAPEEGDRTTPATLWLDVTEPTTLVVALNDFFEKRHNPQADRRRVRR